MEKIKSIVGLPYIWNFCFWNQALNLLLIFDIWTFNLVLVYYQLPFLNFQNGNSVSVKKRMKGVELQSLISEVKDILPHLGDGFIQVGFYCII